MKPDDPYAARAGFVRPAIGRATPGRIVLGLILIEVAWQATGVLLAGGGPDPATAGGALLVNLLFGILLAATIFATRRIQRRRARGLLGRADRLIPDALRVMLHVGGLYLVLDLVLGPGTGDVTLARPPVAWALLLPIALASILLQAGTEEILFRGYLQQSLGAVTDRPWIWLGLPAALFGIAHFDATLPVEAAIRIVIWATALGLALGDLTARTGSLGAAIGAHLAHNAMGSLFVAPEEQGGLALWLVPDPDLAAMSFDVWTTAADLFFVWMLWMACRIAIRA